ncbi:MAG: hypothetical protein AAF558_14500 [Verrucomicrobiota bacterium]
MLSSLYRIRVFGLGFVSQSVGLVALFSILLGGLQTSVKGEAYLVPGSELQRPLRHVLEKNFQGSHGTLGAIVFDMNTGEPRGLTNAHVLLGEPLIEEIKRTRQPVDQSWAYSPYKVDDLKLEMALAGGILGNVTRFKHGETHDGETSLYFDCGIFDFSSVYKHRTRVIVSRRYHSFPFPIDIYQDPPKQKQKVHAVTSQSGLITDGVLFPYSHQQVSNHWYEITLLRQKWRNTPREQRAALGLATRPGDSGSLYYKPSLGFAVGLHYGGSGPVEENEDIRRRQFAHGAGIPLERVMKSMNVYFTGPTRTMAAGLVPINGTLQPALYVFDSNWDLWTTPLYLKDRRSWWDRLLGRSSENLESQLETVRSNPLLAELKTEWKKTKTDPRTTGFGVASYLPGHSLGSRENARPHFWFRTPGKATLGLAKVDWAGKRHLSSPVAQGRSIKYENLVTSNVTPLVTRNGTHLCFYRNGEGFISVAIKIDNEGFFRHSYLTVPGDAGRCLTEISAAAHPERSEISICVIGKDGKTYVRRGGVQVGKPTSVEHSIQWGDAWKYVSNFKYSEVPKLVYAKMVKDQEEYSLLLLGRRGKELTLQRVDDHFFDSEEKVQIYNSSAKIYGFSGDYGFPGDLGNEISLIPGLEGSFFLFQRIHGKTPRIHAWKWTPRTRGVKSARMFSPQGVTALPEGNDLIDPLEVFVDYPVSSDDRTATVVYPKPGSGGTVSGPRRPGGPSGD